MKRRTFIAALGSAAAWPLVARGQQTAMPVIRFLSPGSPEADTSRMNGFRRGLAEVGYVEGENVAIEYRGAQNQYDRLPALAVDLANRQVTVIVTVATPATFAAKAATNTIPIVFGVGADPVQLGLVTSLNRSGGNITGVNNLPAVLGKRLELLHELVPAAGVIALLENPSSAFSEVETKALHEAARALGVELRVLNVANASEIDTAFATTLAKEHSVPLVVSADAWFSSQRDQLVVLAARYAIPAIYVYREFAVAGGLMSYAPILADGYRQMGIYAGRILKGAKPSDLPVQQSVKVELVINLNTAKALGLTIPPSLLARADEVIE
jgi:putative ABC transport system substrate-binding protein